MLWDDVDSLCLIPVCSCGCTCGASLKLSKFQQDQRMIQFLMGLNDSFTVIRGSILMKSPLPSLGQVYSLLLQEETQREIHVNTHFQADSAPLAVNSYISGQYTGYNRKTADAKKAHCNYCKKPDHTIDKCFKLHGFPPDFKFNRNFSNQKKVAAQVEISDSSSVASSVGTANSGTNTGSSHAHTGNNSALPHNISPDIYSQLLNLLKAAQHSDSNVSSANFAGNISVLPSFACLSDSQHVNWILDSGASDHMCSQKHLFITLTLLSNPIHISLPNGDLITISYSGTVPLIHDIILHDVLYVPHFKYNLLSISKLTSHLNCTIQFTSDSCFLQGLLGPNVFVEGGVEYKQYRIIELNAE
ncbi:uncharacterized protein LOC141698200 isoform X2 [Apium graveolens]|uniref:uncharacterized protein LOC141698200 isoform X2 n=1 Tax=Apium graveolens TaxID=4045 RepID=UPI003D7AB2FE